MKRNFSHGYTSVSLLILVFFSLAVLVVIYKGPVSEEFNKIVTTESSVADKIRIYALSMIGNNKEIDKKIRLLEVQYSETGKVAIIVVNEITPVDKDDVLETFETLNDLEYVDDVKVIFN